MAEAMDKEYFDKLAQTIVDGEKDECSRLIDEGLAKGVDPLEAIERGMGQGIIRVGEDFGEGRCFLPELIMAADAARKMEALLGGK